MRAVVVAEVRVVRTDGEGGFRSAAALAVFDADDVLRSVSEGGAFFAALETVSAGFGALAAGRFVLRAPALAPSPAFAALAASSVTASSSVKSATRSRSGSVALTSACFTYGP